MPRVLHFSPHLLPSPFVLSDQIINAMVYGSFFEPSLSLLQYFLIPQTLRGNANSYLLGSFYSYLLLNTRYKKIVYVWHSDDIDCVIGSAEGTINFVLGHDIPTSNDFLSLASFSIKFEDNFACEDHIWAQHVPFHVLTDCSVEGLCIPHGWLEKKTNQQQLSDLFDLGKGQPEIAFVIIDKPHHNKENESITHLSERFADRSELSGTSPHTLVTGDDGISDDLSRQWKIVGLS